MTRPTGPCPARIMIVGEAPGENEEREGVPFVGASGEELNRMLQEAGIMRSECFLTNVVRVRPPGNDISLFFAEKKKDRTLAHVEFNGKWCLPVVMQGIELLKREIELCQPNVIIALGNTAMWALTGKWGITSWRGSTLQSILPLALEYRPKVIPAYHPAAIFRQWSWRNILVHDLKRAKRGAESREIPKRDKLYTVRPSFDQAVGVLVNLLQCLEARPTRLAIDIETRAGHIACIGIGWSKSAAMCIPLMCVERADGYWTADEEVKIMSLLRAVLTHPNCIGIGQNFLYDAQYFHRWLKYVPRIHRDTMIAQHSIFSTLPKGLDFLASMYAENYVYWKDDSKDWDPKVGEDQLWEYNCDDCCYTYEVDEAEQATIKKLSSGPWPKLTYAHDFQQRLFYPVLKMMLRGVRQDRNKTADFAGRMIGEIEKRRALIYTMTGQELNPRSTPQMLDFFYNQLGQKLVLNRETRRPSCDAEALEKIANREPLLRPLVRIIEELRSCGVFLSTFINAPTDTDGRMRCSYNVSGTVTYRFNSRKNAFGTGTNLQNVPKGEEEASLSLPNIRELFIPDPGMTMFDIDLSSADLRIVTWEADEPEMKAMLREGKSPYVEVAKEYYRDPTITKKHKSYTGFKSLCHGTHYLGSAEGLAGRIGLSVREVERIQKWYFGKFPRIKKWQDDFKKQVALRRYVENVFGYRCYFFDRISDDTFREAIAWLPQSTVGILINHALVNIDENLSWAQLLLQVHDSLVGQFPTRMGDWAVQQIVQQAEIPLPYSDPLVIPVGVKTSLKSWGDCE
jgi:DNA polymerase I-like protein with 3'-5' exonuclease and polymerase domains/uracil-DNA glycosylase